MPRANMTDTVVSSMDHGVLFHEPVIYEGSDCRISFGHDCVKVVDWNSKGLGEFSGGLKCIV